MAGPVGAYGLDAGQGTGLVVEGEHALAHVHEPGKARILDHGRPARGQVAGRAAGKPATLGGHVGVFGRGELGQAVPEVVPVDPGRLGHGKAVRELPAFAGQQLTRRSAAAQGQFEHGGCFLGQVDELFEFQVLAAVAHPADDGPFLGRLPGKHRGENVPGRPGRSPGPRIQDYGLAGGNPVHQALGHGAKVLADVFAKGKKHVVAQHFVDAPALVLADRAVQVGGKILLGVERIGIDEHLDRDLGVFLAQLAGGRDVDEDIGPLDHPGQRLGRQPVVAAVGVDNAKTRGQPGVQPFEVLTQVLYMIAHVLDEGDLERIVGPAARVLQIIDVMPQPVKPVEVLDIVPGHAAQGIGRGQPAHDDGTLLHGVSEELDPGFEFKLPHTVTPGEPAKASFRDSKGPCPLAAGGVSLLSHFFCAG